MRTLLIFTFIVALSASCRKEVVVATEPYKPPYRISGIANLKYELSPFAIRPLNFYEKDLNIVYERGAQKLVGIEVSGAPVGMVVTLSSVSGYPGYDTKLILRDTGIVAGIYPLKATLKATDEADLEFPFTVTVTGDASCLNFFSRKYSADRLCDSAGRYEVEMVRAGIADDTVLLTNFRNTGLPLKVAIRCFDGRLQVPRQVIGNLTYSGYGTLYLDPHYYPDAPYVSLELSEEAFPGQYVTCLYSLYFK